ncbi:hypothetical protein MRB53_041213 [Persea americana]|nr:hypothetical protein MRB53_041213 [Persea americana]
MLHWLAGQRPSEEPPETPAPLFAVRAFKHAVFGTPATVQPKSTRRNSNQISRPTRPSITRPKSASDATLMADYFQDIPSSPTKGILLTPGTAGNRGKTVTFGDYIAGGAEEVPETEEELDRNAEPKCAIGRHWKEEHAKLYESANREIRKLTTKQRAAKEYAREKDTRCTALEDELKTERERAEKLQLRVIELEQNIKHMSQQLKAKDEVSKQSDRISISPESVQRQVSSSSLRRKIAAEHGDDAQRRPTDQVDRLPSTTATIPILIEAEKRVLPLTNRRTRLASPNASSPVHQPRAKNNALLDLSVNAHHESTPIRAPAMPETEHPVAHMDEPQQRQADAPPSTKENSVPTADAGRKILSRRGEEIPPDRIAAARARLAARRQQRTDL